MNESLYIHIPFCRKKCIYCDFYSIDYRSDLADSYLEVLCHQIKKLPSAFRTVYIGGGTPSVLPLRHWRALLAALQHKKSRVCEFTVEVNPESLSCQLLELFRRHGVNRISIGLQSLREEKLKKLSRPHCVQEALTAVYLSQKCGFNNISIDCIFGVWQETFSAWKKELQDIARLPVQHISVYCLTYEKGTPLFEKITNMQIKPLGDAITARMYRYALDYLPRRGFQHYEVSNFAKNGFCCQHNLVYWRNDAYWALGAGAVSCRSGRREKTTTDIRRYLEAGFCPAGSITESESLSPQSRARETAALKIRTKEGIDFCWFKKSTGFSFLDLYADTVGQLSSSGLVRQWRRKTKPAGIRLTKKGFLYCDEVSSALL